MMRERLRAAAAALLVAGPAAAQAAPGDDYGYGYHGMMGWGGWFMGPLMMLLFVALIVAAVMIALRLLGMAPGGPKSGDDALEILRQRFARGEIDREEFEERKKHLT